MDYFRWLLTVHGRLTGGGGSAAAFSPLSLSPHLWLDPSDLTTLWKDTSGTDPVTADGDAVARIDDKSGNGLNLTQATEGSRPLYKTSGGFHWLEGDGDDDFLTVSSSPVSQPTCWAVAGRFITTPAGRNAMLGNTGAGSIFFEFNGNFLLYAGLEATGATAVADGTDFVAICIFNGASSRIDIDGETGDDINPGTETESGAQIFSRQSMEFANARIYEHLRFDYIPNSAQLASLVTYLAAKQGRVL